MFFFFLELEVFVYASVFLKYILLLYNKFAGMAKQKKKKSDIKSLICLKGPQRQVEGRDKDEVNDGE